MAKKYLSEATQAKLAELNAKLEVEIKLNELNIKIKAAEDLIISREADYEAAIKDRQNQLLDAERKCWAVVDQIELGDDLMDKEVTPKEQALEKAREKLNGLNAQKKDLDAEKGAIKRELYFYEFKAELEEMIGMASQTWVGENFIAAMESIEGFVKASRDTLVVGVVALVSMSLSGFGFFKTQGEGVESMAQVKNDENIDVTKV